MDKMPKRRKYQDNPYTLNKDEEKKIYLVKFKDTIGMIREITVSKEIFDTFNSFELQDIMQMNEFDRHIEHSKVFENNLNNKTNKEIVNIEDEFIRKATFEKLKKAIDMLPEIQKRRIKKYYFEEMTQQQIADDEQTNIRAVQYTLRIALKNLKNFLN